MEITEVRIKMADGNDERLRAFCSITFDNSFVVRDIKIIDGPSGLFVAMPARQATTSCAKCRSKNSTRSNYCGHCGDKLSRPADHGLGEKLYADIAHPINPTCRDQIQSKILAAFLAEQDSAAQNPVEVDATHNASGAESSVSGSSPLIVDAAESHRPSKRPYHPAAQ